MTGTIRYWIQETRGAEVHSGGMPFSVSDVTEDIIMNVHAEAFSQAMCLHSFCDPDNVVWRSRATLESVTQ